MVLLQPRGWPATWGQAAKSSPFPKEPKEETGGDRWASTQECPRLVGREVVPALGKSCLLRQQAPVLGSFWLTRKRIIAKHHGITNCKGRELQGGENRTLWDVLEGEELPPKKNLSNPITLPRGIRGSPRTDPAQPSQCLFCCFENCFSQTILDTLLEGRYQKVKIFHIQSIPESILFEGWKCLLYVSPSSRHYLW